MSSLTSANFIDKCQVKLTSSAQYQKLKALPKLQFWLAILGLFLLTQVIVFGALYLFFGKIAMIGFLACVLASLATGLGALPDS
jgi:ZIP family zinc transporter